MTFKTTLYKALDAATIVIVNGVEVDNDEIDSGGCRCLYLADDTTVYLQDEEIEVDDGQAKFHAWDTDEHRQPYNPFEELNRIEFQVLHPLRESDL